MATAIIMPKLGQSVESCIIVDWKKEAGDEIAQGETICEVETDKALLEIDSSVSGTVLEIFFQTGDEVHVQTNIAAVGELGENVSNLRPDNMRPENSGLSVERITATDNEIEAPVESCTVNPRSMVEGVPRQSDLNFSISPRAEALATKLGIDTSGIQGTGPNGRVIEKDVEFASLTRQPVTPLARAVATEQNLIVPASGSGIGSRVILDDLKSGVTLPETMVLVDVRKQEIPAQRMRRVIAERMLNSVQSTTRFTLNASADARNLLSLRQRLKKHAELQQVTINDLILFLVSRALIDYPQLNALFANNSISRSKQVNLGFTVDTERGLLVPIIKNADDLSLKEMSQEAKRLSSVCLEGKVSPDDLIGGTFTVINLGILGIESFTPILNVPQVGILGVGDVNLKPVEVNGKIEFISHIGLSLTVNRQTVEDFPAARFLCAFSQQISKIDSVVDITEKTFNE